MKPYDQEVEHILPYESFLCPFVTFPSIITTFPSQPESFAFCHCRLHFIEFYTKEYALFLSGYFKYSDFEAYPYFCVYQ